MLEDEIKLFSLNMGNLINYTFYLLIGMKKAKATVKMGRGNKSIGM